MPSDYCYSAELVLGDLEKECENGEFYRQSNDIVDKRGLACLSASMFPSPLKESTSATMIYLADNLKCKTSLKTQCPFSLR